MSDCDVSKMKELMAQPYDIEIDLPARKEEVRLLRAQQTELEQAHKALAAPFLAKGDK